MYVYAYLSTCIYIHLAKQLVKEVDLVHYYNIILIAFMHQLATNGRVGNFITVTYPGTSP